MQHAPRLDTGRYRLGRCLGRGGMAVVWEAWDEALGAWRALKVLDVGGGLSTRARRRFENEGRAMARLRHPNVLTVFDVGEDADGRPFLVMELASGGSLADVTERMGPLPPRVAVRLVRAVLDGLQHAHDHGIVHRDVKPQNILLTAEGQPMVADFGIARMESVDQTRTGAAVGTLAYMAPEQRSSARHVDARADVYAAAGTLYGCLTGREPLDLYVDRADWSCVPEPLVPVLRRATAYDREERHASARELAEALAALEDALPPEPEGFQLELGGLGQKPAASAETFDVALGFGEPTDVPHTHVPGTTTAEGPLVAEPPRRPLGVGLAVLAGLALATVAGVVLLREPPPVTWVLKPMDVVDLGLYGLDASADGTLHYVAEGKLWRHPPDGTREALLPWTEGTFFVEADGTVVRTDWWHELPLRRQVDGAEEELPVAGRLARLSPDGQRVAYAREGRVEVAGYPDGGEPRVLANLGLQNVVFDMSWSRGGRWLAVAVEQMGLQLQLLPAEGGPTVTLPVDDRMFSPIRTAVTGWLDDERLWVGRGDGPDAIFEELRIDRHGAVRGEGREVARWTGGAWPILAHFAPDGRRVSVLTAAVETELVLDGADLEPETLALPAIRNARWAGDGALIASTREGLFERGDDLDWREVAQGPWGSVNVAGRWALPERVTSDGGRSVWRVDLGGNAPPAPLLTLTERGVLACRPEVSRCVVAEPSGVVFHLFWLDPHSGELSERFATVGAAREAMVALALSPSGREVAMFDASPDVVLLDTETRASRRLPVPLSFAQSGGFSEDGRTLHVIGNTGARWAVARIPLDGGPTEVLEDPTARFGDLDVGPDGRQVLTRRITRAEAWTLTPAR